jgi:hypothetical protein
MITRRGLLQSGTAALSASVLGVGPFTAKANEVETMAASATAARAHTPRIHKILYDRRFAQSAAFGLEAARAGLATRPFDGDVTALWYHELYPQWRERPAPMAGMTGQGAIFCLERLAWDAGMRVTFRVDHKVLEDGSVEHIPASDAATAVTLALRKAGSQWARESARLLTRTTPGIVAPSGPHQDADPAGVPWLVSWVISPKQA